MGERREIAKSRRFESELRELFRDAERGDVILEGLEWTLHRIADFGNAVAGTSLLQWHVEPGDGFLYNIYYRVMDGKVILESIRRRPAPPPNLYSD